MSIYLERYAYPPLSISAKPLPNTGLIVVIPVFNEEYTLKALDSLLDSKLPSEPVEVLIIINNAIADQNILQQNEKCLSEIEHWISDNPKEGIHFYVRHIEFSKKHAGVGFARKAGMDEATRRFEQIGNEKGIILCFDADCVCEANYLLEVYSQFNNHNLKGASIYYEHKMELLSKNEKTGITQYELHLRYYINGLRKANYPYSFHTVGSSMAVRTDIYKKAGGMNRRKAGEDFHFLHKVIPYGNFRDVTTTSVYPSARISDRVPFGTGKAMGDWTDQKKTIFNSYDPTIFKDVAKLLKLVPQFYKTTDATFVLQKLPETIQAYLLKENFSMVLRELNKKSPSLKVFLQHWFGWFNGLKVLHLVHYLRDNSYPSIPVLKAAAVLINYPNSKPDDLLMAYRKIDRAFNADQISLKHLYSEFL